MPRFQREHIILPTPANALPYTSPNKGRSKVESRATVDRKEHGNNIRNQFNAAVADFGQPADFDGVYVVFRSPLDFRLDIDKFDKGELRLAYCRSIVEYSDNTGSHSIYEATVFLNRRAVAQFLSKIEQYIERDTKKGNPKNQSLIANIEEIRAATLQSFWQEPETPFPPTEEITWWEVWFNRDGFQEDTDLLEQLGLKIKEAHIQASSKFLIFPEHLVCMLRCTAVQLQRLLYTNTLAEIRKPRETADFFVTLEHREQDDWIADLVLRTDNLSQQSKVSICLLDTGVNRSHPLLEPLVPERHLDAINPAWSVADTRTPNGHGTPMAGLALYGDLSDLMANSARVQIYHHLESIKIINDNAPHEPALYGAVTQEAIARSEVINPLFKRVVCMAVTCADTVHKGRPTSWSAAVDQITFGVPGILNEHFLMVISSGNLSFEDRATYPLGNLKSTIQDPAQSYNALTVGAYTTKDQFDIEVYPNAKILARRGAMSPSNTTSFDWQNDWCKKPDIVMEAGNNAIQHDSVIDPPSLQLLSTSRGGIGRSPITSFGDTSAATALASKFAAELYVAYPSLRPETIRALIVHSSDWTPEMLANRNISQLTPNEKERLLRQVGYGVPNFTRARYSLNNSLSMIIERSLTPFKFEDNKIKTNEFHLFDLPWPTQVLQELLGTSVKLSITLSYFIEPNPGNKTYELSASYKSHGLRYKMIDRGESLEAFQGRISKTLRDGDYESEGRERNWLLGPQLRDKGSIHKDIWEGTAAELAVRNKIAIYPVGGWWKTRRKLKRYDSRVNYSLVITIDTPSVETDIYTPVANEIVIKV